MLLIIDNYDSFTFNLVQAIGKIGCVTDAFRCEIQVVRNDEVTVDQIESNPPNAIIISPGPCSPSNAGISNDVIRRFHGRVPILGVCLGHQCIGAVFGATVKRAESVMHGKTSEIHHDGRTIFEEITSPFIAARYHSLVVEAEQISDQFEISAWTKDGICMGLRHRTARTEGVQFHPESFLTSDGERLLRNFLECAQADSVATVRKQ